MNFSRLSDYFDSIEDVYGIPGCDCSIYFKHEEVFRRSIGHRDLKKTQPVTKDDLYWIYSCSKIATCVSALQLIEQGKLHLADPISDYLPEYKHLSVRSKDSIMPCLRVPTIEDLFTMSAGLNYAIGWPSVSKLISATADANTREVIKALAQEPLDFVPGSHFQYSMCHDVLAAIVELISGMRFSSYIREHIAKPLGMKDMEFHLYPENKNRLAAQYRFDALTGIMDDAGPGNLAVFTDNYDSGGGGILTRVSDYVLLADALANGGVGASGERILASESIDSMKRNRLDTTRLSEFRRTGKYGYGYGLGVRTLIYKTASEGPLGEFGWDGAAGAYFLADSANHIAIFYSQHILGFHDVYMGVHPAIRDLTYLALDKERSL